MRPLDYTAALIIVAIVGVPLWLLATTPAKCLLGVTREEAASPTCTAAFGKFYSPRVMGE